MVMEVVRPLISTLLSQAAKLLLVERDQGTMLTLYSRHCSDETIGGCVWVVGVGVALATLLACFQVF